MEVFYCDRPKIAKLGSKPFGDILDFIKASGLPLGGISKFKRMFKAVYFDQSNFFPANWKLWRNLITRYRLYEVSSIDEWALVIGKVDDLRIPFRRSGAYQNRDF